MTPERQARAGERRARSVAKFAKMAEGLREVSFEAWTPRRPDGSISYAYVSPADGSLIRRQDRWQRQKSYIAQAALHTGVELFVVRGGVGAREWRLLLVVPEEDAEAWLRDAAERDFTLKGTLWRALEARDRRKAALRRP